MKNTLFRPVLCSKGRIAFGFTNSILLLCTSNGENFKHTSYYETILQPHRLRSYPYG